MQNEMLVFALAMKSAVDESHIINPTLSPVFAVSTLSLSERF